MPPVRETHRRLQFALGILLIVGAMPALAAGPDEKRLATGVDPLGAADTFGGYTTTHILVRLEAGLLPRNVAGGGVTIDNGVIDGMSQAWGATAIESILPAAIRQGAAAVASGLDRTYRLHVPRGSDTPEMVAQFASLPGVELAETDGIGGIAETIPNDPGFWQLWGMHNTGQAGGTVGADIDATLAWDLSIGSAAVIIAMLDTGIQADHPDLAGKVISGWNTYDNNSDTSDPHGHGTHTAGTAAAIGNNGVGVAGVNWEATLLAMTVVNDFGSGFESHVAAGILWATNYGVDVISMSLQYYTGTTTLREAVSAAHNAGILLIAANGNGGSNVVAYPARFPLCMAVGGTTRNDLWYTGANFGPETDVSGPAKDVLSTWRLSGYQLNSGTSMATPHVSGLASLVLSYNDALSNVQIESILVASVDDLGPAGFDEKFGWGRINAHAALLAADPRGDLNCDGTFNGADIDPFFLALGDPATYAILFEGCDPLLRGDMNDDGLFNGGDIDPFFLALGGG